MYVANYKPTSKLAWRIIVVGYEREVGVYLFVYDKNC